MNTLKGRLMAIFVITGLVGLGTLGFLAIDRSGRALTAAAEKEGVALTGSVAKMIDSVLLTDIGAVSLMASTPEIGSMNWDRQKAFIEKIDATKTGIQEFWIVDSDGTGRYIDGSTLALGDREYVKRALSEGKVVLSEPVLSKKTNELVLVIAAPVFPEGTSKAGGILCGRISLEDLQKTVDGFSWGETGYVFVLDRKGMVVLHPNKEHRGTLDASKESKAITGELAEIVRKGLAGASGIDRYMFEGREKLAAFSPAGMTGWLVFTSAYQDEFVVPVTRMRNVIIAITLALISLIAVVSFFIARSIARPIESTVETMKAIASGNLDVALADGSSLREISDLKKAIDTMTAQMSSALMTVRSSAKAVLDRSQDVNAAIEEANATADQVLSMTVKGNDMAQATAATVEQTNSSISEVAEGAQSGALNAVQAGEAAENTSHEAEKGSRALEEMVSVIKNVSQAGDKVGEAIQSLDASVDSIGQFVTTITTIADQTNLLALNAAIEAARAGEHGRGFAVVAEEVRKLAEESNKAAQNVGALIENIVTRTKMAAKDQGQVSSLIGELVSKTDQTREVFGNVVTRMNAIAENVQSIAAAAEEQSASTQEMASGVDHISTNTKQIAEALHSITDGMTEAGEAFEMMARSAEELVHLSNEMEKAVNHFNLRDGGGMVPLARKS